MKTKFPKSIFCFISIIAFFIMTLPYDAKGSDEKPGIQLTDAEQTWLDQKHTVRVRVANWPPFMFAEKDVKGVSIDYIKMIFDFHRIDYQFISGKEIPWKDALEHIKNHQKIDLIPTAKITEERKKFMVFTDEYLFLPMAIFSRNDSLYIGGIEDLFGKSISVQSGYVMHKVLEKEYPDINLMIFSGGDNATEQCIKALAVGKVDAYIGNLAVGSYLVQSKGYGNVKVAAPTPFNNHNQAMGMRNDWPELAGIINKTLASMKPEEHAAIRNKWLSVRYEYGIDKIYVLKWVLSVAGIAFFLIGFVLFWNKRLKSEIILRKKTEAELKKQRDFFELIINSVPARIFWKDLDLVYLGCNIHFAKDAGMETPENIIGRNDNDLVWKKDAEMYRADDRQIINTGKPKLLYEEPFLNKDGRKIWWLTNKMPLKNPDGEIIGIVATSENITDRKNTEKEKQRLETQLQQFQKMESIGNLAGGIAHDFNNILFPIIGMAELLTEDLTPGSLESDNAGEILKAGKRGSDLVKQILSFSRQHAHRFTPVRVQNILREVLKLSRSTIPSDIQIHQEINPNCGTVKADATQIHQVAMNLITNAYHAVEETGGEITVALDEADLVKEDYPDDLLKNKHCVVLTVSDNGVGISRRNRQKIFEPYFTTKEQGKGTGLGLSVVYGILKEHQGDIRVHSAPGKGATFKVFLPLMEAQTESMPEKKESILETGDEHILLVDDEISIVNLEKTILERLGYKVTACSHSAEALQIFQTEPATFDLVISDMTMPDITGDKLARALLSIRADIPIIICTGYSERIDQETAGEIGVKGLLMKPVIRSELAKMVRKTLDASKLPDKT